MSLLNPLTHISKLRKANISWVVYFVLFPMTFFTRNWGFYVDGEDVPIQWRGILTFYLVMLVLDLEEILKAYADPREPPMIPSRVPFVGHVIGMFRYGARYFEIVNQNTQYPIYTLQTGPTRTIIITTPHLAAPVQRTSPHLSFYTAILEVTKRLVAFDEPTMRIIRWNVNREHGPTGLMNEDHDMIATELGPGSALNEMSKVQLERFGEVLEDVVPTGEVEMGLMEFVKEVFTKSNAFAIYGPRNPFIVQPNLTKDFWTYEAGMISLMANIAPSITARKYYYARERVFSALQEFVETGAYKTASPMIRKRVEIALKYGLTTKMAGHAHLILLFGILGNAVPTTFWLLAHIFSRPSLLSSIRAEITASPAVSIAADGSRVLSVEKLKSACPLLVSTYRETLRDIGNLSSIRAVLSPTTISNYLLKRGSLIQIASGILHKDPATWGPDAHIFNPHRFISPPSPSGETGEKEVSAMQLPKNVPSAAYRAFGGGSVICPGRHFAQSEIVGFVALVVMGFEVVGGDGGVVVCPEKDDGRVPLSVMKPVRDVSVRVRRRGEEGGRWRLVL